MSTGLNRFDWIAPYYDKITSLIFGKAMRNAQTCNLHIVPSLANVLVLGGGTGAWLDGLIKSNETCKIWFIEASSVMLERAKANLENDNRVVFVHGTEMDIPQVHFHVVITHFFLDMYSDQQLGRLINLMEKNFSKTLFWIVADFERSRFWHASFLKLMYLFFRISGTMKNNKLPNWNNVLETHHYKIKESEPFYGNFIQSRVYVKETLD